MLEAAGNILQDLDRIFSGLALTMSAVQPGCDRQNDDDKSIPEDREEKE